MIATIADWHANARDVLSGIEEKIRWANEAREDQRRHKERVEARVAAVKKTVGGAREKIEKRRGGETDGVLPREKKEKKKENKAAKKRRKRREEKERADKKAKAETGNEGRNASLP